MLPALHVSVQLMVFAKGIVVETDAAAHMRLTPFLRLPFVLHSECWLSVPAIEQTKESCVRKTANAIFS